MAKKAEAFDWSNQEAIDAIGNESLADNFEGDSSKVYESMHVDVGTTFDAIIVGCRVWHVGREELDIVESKVSLDIESRSGTPRGRATISVSLATDRKTRKKGYIKNVDGKLTFIAEQGGGEKFLMKVSRLIDECGEKTPVLTMAKTIGELCEIIEKNTVDDYTAELLKDRLTFPVYVNHVDYRTTEGNKEGISFENTYLKVMVKDRQKFSTVR